MIRKSILSILLLTCFPLSIWSQGHEARLSQLDVLHYTFALQLSDETDTIRGEAEMKLQFKEPIDHFYLDLVSPGNGERGMRVSEVWAGEEAASFRQAGDSLVILLAKALPANETVELQITYAGVPADGLVISQNRFGDRTFFGDNWPNRAHHWLPCVDHPSDKATVEFIVTAPDHYQVVANGRQVEETNVNDTYKRTHWYESAPLPTKVMVIGVAPFAVQYIGEVNDIPLSSWIFPEDREAGFYDYEQARFILDWFIQNIGPYPFEKLANVQSKTRYGGMENAGNIFYSENSVTGDRSSEALFAHEIAHQWFGNSASEANWHHLWLSEGFATYFTNLYMEDKYGRERFVERLHDERNTVLAYARRRPAPVVDTTVTDYNQLLNPNSYQKGGWVLHMLRHRLGDEDFWQGIRAYYEKYKIDNALTADFQKVMEQVSGQDLEQFFRQWLFTAGHPRLETEWSYDESEKVLNLEVRQTQTGMTFYFPLEIELRDSQNGNARRWTLDISQKWHRFSFPLDFEPGGMVVDPDTLLLFESR